MLLIDELLATKNCLNVTSGWGEFRERLAKAQHFDLAPDFAATAEQLATDYNVIAGAVPYCRLPFPEMWIEVAQAVRPRYHTASIHIPELQKMPHRVGFLLTADDDKHCAFTAHQFWTLKDYLEPTACHIAMNFDPARGANAPEIDYDRRETEYFKIEPSPMWQHATPQTRGALTAIVKPALTDYLTNMEFAVAAKEETDFGRYVFEVGAADWSGEAVYLLATLALLNTVNAVAQTTVNNDKLNASRKRRKQLPLVNHYVLSISTRLKDRVRGGPGGQKDNYGNLRAHIVRGHWKVRKTGIYFWRSYMRGDHGKGTIEKSYRVTS